MGAQNLDSFSVRAAPFDRDGDFGNTRKITTGQRIRRGGNLVRFPDSDQVATGVSGAGTEIDYVIGAANGVFVVFDDENCIAKIAKAFQRIEEAIIVARV